MAEPLTIAAIIATFILAGTVKGVIGMGLPTISLGLLTAMIDLPTAMVLLIVPSFVINLWQSLAGGKARETLMRIWPFLLMVTVTVWIGALALTRLDLSLLSALLGVLLVTYGLISLAGFRLEIARERERWAGPVLGAINGVLTGMTGSFVVPGVIFLQSIGLARDALIQAMGMLFLASTVALAVALGGNDLLTPRHGVLSAAALAPAGVGMVIGQRIRKRLPEARFREVFFTAILLLGCTIIARAVV